MHVTGSCIEYTAPWLNVSCHVQEDWIGLKQLDHQNKVKLEECPGQHMHVTLDWCESHVIRAHLQS